MAKRSMECKLKMKLIFGILRKFQGCNDQQKSYVVRRLAASRPKKLQCFLQDINYLVSCLDTENHNFDNSGLQQLGGMASRMGSFQGKTFAEMEQKDSEPDPFFSRDGESEIREPFHEGKWSLEENLKFVIFITLNKVTFKSKEKRKGQKAFKNVAVFIGTRNSQQCRSHFQKLIKKFNTIAKLKKNYRNLIGPTEFDRRIQEASQKLICFQFLNKSKHIKSQRQAQVQTQISIPAEASFPTVQTTHILYNPLSLFCGFSY